METLVDELGTVWGMVANNSAVPSILVPSQGDDFGVEPDAITNLLRRQIRLGELKPGSRLIQNQIAERYGVSRIPVREALRTLAAEGLVVIERGRGAAVARLSAQDALDLYDLRLAIEPPMATPIVELAGPRDLRHLDRYVHALSDCGDDNQRYSELNLEFHLLVYSIADKPIYARFIRQLLSVIEPYSRVYLHVLGGVGRAQAEHSAMTQAIKDRDASELERLIVSHLTGARNALVQHLASVDANATSGP